jgi:hypothetical protein
MACETMLSKVASMSAEQYASGPYAGCMELGWQ